MNNSNPVESHSSFPHAVADPLLWAIVSCSVVVSLSNLIRSLYQLSKTVSSRKHDTQQVPFIPCSQDLIPTSEVDAETLNDFRLPSHEAPNQSSPEFIRSISLNTLDDSLTLVEKRSSVAGLYRCYKLLCISNTMWFIGCSFDLVGLLVHIGINNKAIGTIQTLATVFQGIGIAIYLLMVLIRFQVVHFIRPYPQWVDKLLLGFLLCVTILFCLFTIPFLLCHFSNIPRTTCSDIRSAFHVYMLFGLVSFVVVENVIGILLIHLVYRHQKRIVDMLVNTQTRRSQADVIFKRMRGHLYSFSASLILVSWLSVLTMAIRFYASNLGLDAISTGHLRMLGSFLPPLFNSIQFSLAFIYIKTLEKLKRIPALE